MGCHGCRPCLSAVQATSIYACNSTALGGSSSLWTAVALSSRSHDAVDGLRLRVACGRIPPPTHVVVACPMLVAPIEMEILHIREPPPPRVDCLNCFYFATLSALR